MTNNKTQKILKMRLKIGFTLIFFFSISFTFGQEHKNNTKSLEDFDTTIEEDSYKLDDSVYADKFIIQTSEQEEQKHISMANYTNKEWKEIKKEITIAKKRVISNKEVFLSKVIDTIFIVLPNISNETQLSSW